jgi:hypothetical protein
MLHQSGLKHGFSRSITLITGCILLCCTSACSGDQDTVTLRATATATAPETPTGPRTHVTQAPIFGENRKVILNPVLIRDFREGGLGLTGEDSGVISTLLELSIVVGQKSCDHFPEYFADIADKIASAQRNKEFATSGYLNTPVHIDVLTNDIKGMPCIVGLSTTAGFQNTQQESGGDTSVRDYLTALGYQQSRAKWTELTGGKKVKVAVVDTGVDLDNDDIAGVVPSLPGADHVRRDDKPEDENGHGTGIASVLTAKGSRGNNVSGLGAGSIEVLPVKVVRPDGSTTSVEVANGIYRAINLGAEVINISVGSTISGCDPTIGFAIEHGITRNVFFTISAGNNSSLVIPARRDAVTSFEKTNAPACWALYFKGAMAVASLDSNSGDLARFSNYGTAIEIAAPGVGIPVYGLASTVGIKRGTSFSAPMVAAAAALMIAAHKNLGIHYDPWLIEDRIINGTEENPKLSDKIYKSRQLNMKKLGQYIDALKNKTSEERQQEPYNDPTIGDGYRFVDKAVDKMVRLELLTSSQIVGVTERAAVRARAYYASGAYFIVTPDVQWTSSDPLLLAIDQNGLLRPSESATGKSVTVTGRYQGFVTSISVSVNSMNDISGENSKIDKLEVIQKKISPTAVEFDVMATFNDGSTRALGHRASWSSSDESSLRHKGFWNIDTSDWDKIIENPFPGGFTFNPNLEAAKTVRVTAAYRGKYAHTDFKVTPLLYQSGHVSVVTEGTGGGAWNHMGEFGTTNIEVTIIKGVEYLLRGNAKYQNTRMSNPLGLHKGTWRSNVPSINFDQQFPTGNAKSTLDAVSANLILDPNIEPGYYDIAFESSPFYPASLGQKFTVAIRLKVIDDIATKIEITGPATAPWGKSMEGHKVFGTYETGLRKQMPPSELEFQAVSDDGNVLNKSWMEIRVNDSYAYLRSFDDGSNRDIQLKATHKTTSLKAEKKIRIYGLDNFGLTRQAAIPRNLVAPQPRQEDGTCTDALKLQSPFAGGNGSAASPFIICSYTQFKNIPTVTMDSCTACRPYAHYRQKAHLDLSVTGSVERFAPIQPKMESVYDGDGHEIQNLFIDERETGMRSLLNGPWVKIENLGMRKPNVRGSNHVAAILSHSNRLETMSNVYLIDGTVEGNIWVGGVVGYLNAPSSGTIFENIRVFGTRINGDNQSGSVLGGGSATQSIPGGKILMKGIYSTAQVANSGLFSNCLGGLVGNASFTPSPKTSIFNSSLTSESSVHGFTLADSAFEGSVTQSGPGAMAEGSNSAGGIFGCSRFATLIDVENTGAVTTVGGKVGGIAGAHFGLNGSEHGLMLRVRNSGAVTGGQMRLDHGIGSAAGGLVGELCGGTIVDSNVSANVSGVRYSGGFAGVVREFVSLRDSRFTGAINSANIENGGFAALNYRIKNPVGMPVEQSLERLQSSGHNFKDIYLVD